MTLRRETSVWAHMIVAAAISGFTTSVSVTLADPEHFNWSHQGVIAILKVSVISAIVSVAAVLKQSPLPRQSEPVAVAGPSVMVESQNTTVVEPPK